MGLIFQFCSPSSWFKHSCSQLAQLKASEICTFWPNTSEPRALHVCDQSPCRSSPCSHCSCTRLKFVTALLKDQSLLVQHAEDECTDYRTLLASSCMNTVDPAGNLGSTRRKSCCYLGAFHCPLGKAVRALCAAGGTSSELSPEFPAGMA